ncbi:MAG: hypothetical protein N3D84_03510, partial [Candidatus Woesearchaeota archaeon]|nr:hypothetical protein [Candidatus Woesearchaeota archaeon]
CKETSNSTAMCIFNIQNQQWPFELNLSEMDASMETTKGAMRPYSLVYAEGNIFREKRMNNTIPYSMAFITNNNGMKAVLMSPELAGSMFTRLFYFNGTGLKHFDYFDYERDLTGLEIYTWKINWEGKE